MEIGNFYLGRVIKIGNLNQETLMRAIVDAKTVTVHKFDWAITDVVDRRTAEFPYIFGRLSKFARDGQVKLVDETRKSQVDALAKNLLIASAPFVYLPDFSGIAYLHVWNQIQDDVFPRRFKTIIEATYDKFFVDCSIEPVADYREFVIRLRELDEVTKIAAVVHPPNPLFGRLWKPLRDYLKKRNATEIRVSESADVGSLKTDLVPLVASVVDKKIAEFNVPIDLTDSAVLMAADGYGKGTVVGQKNGERRVIRTSDSQKSFPFPKDPDPHALALEAEKYLARVSDERDLEHP